MSLILTGNDAKWKLEEKWFARGGNSLVYKANNHSEPNDMNLYAVKLFDSKVGTRRDRFLREIDTLKKIENINGVCRIIDYGFDDDTPFFVMPYYSNGTLAQKYINNGSDVSLVETLSDFIEICMVVRSLHLSAPPLAVRDIKPSNILFDAQKNIVLCDFGLSLWSDTDESERLSVSAVGSRGFRPPEWLERYPDSNQISGDIWSLGRTLWCMISKKQPPENAVSLGTKKYHISQFLSSEMHIKGNYIQSLINYCLKVDPNERPTIDSLIDESIDIKTLLTLESETPLGFEKEIRKLSKELIGNVIIEQSEFEKSENELRETEVLNARDILCSELKDIAEEINKWFSPEIGKFCGFGLDNTNNHNTDIYYGNAYIVFFPNEKIKQMLPTPEIRYTIHLYFSYSTCQFTWQETLGLESFKHVVKEPIYPKSLFLLAGKKVKQLRSIVLKEFLPLVKKSFPN
jgi:serine/threonine protein kinase